MPLLQMKAGLSKLLLTTRFAGAPIVAVAAKPGGPEVYLLTGQLSGCYGNTSRLLLLLSFLQWCECMCLCVPVCIVPVHVCVLVCVHIQMDVDVVVCIP